MTLPLDLQRTETSATAEPGERASVDATEPRAWTPAELALILRMAEQAEPFSLAAALQR